METRLKTMAGRASLTPRQIAKEVAKKAGKADLDLAELYIQSLIDVICDEIKNTGVCRIANLGTFRLKETGGKFRTVPNRGGGYREEWINPKISAHFVPANSLKEILNSEYASVEDRRLEKVKKKRALKSIKEEIEYEKRCKAKAEERKSSILIDRRK